MLYIAPWDRLQFWALPWENPMGKFEEYPFFAHFGHFSIILKQNLIFQTILLVIMALCSGGRNILRPSKWFNLSVFSWRVWFLSQESLFSCGFPWQFSGLMSLLMLVFLFLFAEFYVQNYTAKKSGAKKIEWLLKLLIVFIGSELSINVNAKCVL